MRNRLIVLFAVSFLAAGCARKQQSLPPDAGEMKAVGVAADKAGIVDQKTAKTGISVEDAVVCTGVVDRVPQGSATRFSSSCRKLYFYTAVTGAARPVTIYHCWSRDGREVARIPVSVQSSRWRAFSSKKIDTAAAGQWEATAVDADGKELASVAFIVQ